MDNEVFKGILIDNDNLSIQRIKEKCINCGSCKRVCPMKDKIDNNNLDKCIGCGMCIKSCPVAAIYPKFDYNIVLDKINNEKDKVFVSMIAPGVKTSIGDGFNIEIDNLEKRIISVLRKFGFNYVYDVTIGADITTYEESIELIDRFEKRKDLPLFTSCCPAWVKYLELNYNEYNHNLSIVKSPILIAGTLIKKYLSKKLNKKESDIIVVAIAPCTAKKQEIKKIKDCCDYIISANGFIDMIKENNIDFNNINESEYDELFVGSKTSNIYGRNNGVLTSVIKNVYKLMTGEDISLSKVNFEILEEYNNVKLANIKIKDRIIKVASVDGYSNISKIMEDIKDKKIDIDFVEFMMCPGGCVNGGGQPLNAINLEKDIAIKRKNVLDNIDINSNNRYNYINKNVDLLYKFINDNNIDKSILHVNQDKRKED